MKYIVLEFDNDDEADSFAGTITEGPAASIRVKAVFRKPSQFCECPPTEKSARGAKWGWWICTICAKPKRGQWQHPRNLLDPIDLPTRERKVYLGVVEGL